MANIHTGSVVIDIRGSLGNETYARNRGGLYVRERTGPADNTGDLRDAAREALAAVSTAWSSTLTQIQRDSWGTYAKRFPRIDTWGNPNPISGFNQFVKNNLLYYLVFTALGYAAPPSGPPMHQPVFTFAAAEAGDLVTVSLNFPTYTPPIATQRMYIFAGASGSAGISFYNGPWRYTATNLWGVAWSADPWTIEWPWDVTTGDKVWARMLTQNNTTGAISSQYVTSAIAT